MINASLTRSSWYVGEPPGSNGLNSYDSVKKSYPESYQRLNWSLAAEPLFQAIFDPALHKLMYTAYERGGYIRFDSQESGGVFFSYPLKYTAYYLNFDCKGGKNYYDFLCRPWYRQISSLKKSYDANDPSNDPFLL